jgi:2-polyprenyl-3-methyl-5-hydroxy-6-metoxy-1,4-benzoquinol methylase
MVAFDVVYSNNLLECLEDPKAIAQEIARMLRPGGALVVGHWDLDSQTFDGSPHARVLINTSYAAPWYGHARARDLGALVEQGLATADDYARFIASLEELAAQARYFYSITGYAYVGRRLP